MSILAVREVRERDLLGDRNLLSHADAEGCWLEQPQPLGLQMNGGDAAALEWEFVDRGNGNQRDALVGEERTFRDVQLVHRPVRAGGAHRATLRRDDLG